MSLSPDELDALADDLAGVAARWAGSSLPVTPGFVRNFATVARDLAALQRWAEKAADVLDGGDRSHVAALLAEYAEMKEKP